MQRACAGNQQLASQVNELIASHLQAGSFMEAGDPAAAPYTAVDSADSKIGPYVLQKRIGQGGMGIVFLAEQTEPFNAKSP